MHKILTTDEELKSWMTVGLFTSLVLKKLKEEQPELLKSADTLADTIMNKLEESGLMREVATAVLKRNLTYGNELTDILGMIQEMYPQALE